MLSAPSLSKTLGISTTPIREALLQLSSDGSLQPRRNRGFCVVGPTLEELRNVFEVRVQLETFALVKLAETGLDDVRELESPARQIAEAVEAGDVMRYLAADRAFHLELLTRAGNDVLTGTVMRLRDTMRLYGIRSRAGLARQRASVPEHYKIIEALGRLGRKDLTALMREHILSWEPVFTEAIKDHGPSSGPLATPPERSVRP